MKKQFLTLLTLLLLGRAGYVWGDDTTATIDFGSSGYGDLVTIAFSDGSKTTGSLVDATLGSSSTKAYSSVYSDKGLSTSFTSKNSYNNIGQISCYVSTTDKGKTYLAVEVCPNEDFSSDITTVQASAVLNGGGLPTNVSNNNQYYQETFTLASRVSGYVRITVSEASGSSGKTINVGKIGISYIASSEAYTVTFDAGSNGSCATSSLTEASAGAGITLPSATPNSGYVFNGWFTASSAGTKIGDAGYIYHPTSAITLYAQYVEQSAPSIDLDNYEPSTPRGKAITFTATASGAPTPTVTWYQSVTATTSGGTEKGTGATYNPDVTTEGTFYYYAVASNGVSPDATSDLITLTVTSPNVDRSGYNTYYVAKGETVVGGEQVLCDDITMTYDDVTYNAGSKDDMIKSLNSNYVASVTTSTNGWGVTFTPSLDGALSVGVVANNDKTFSITNVTSFIYKDKDSNTGTITSSSWTPTTKFYGIITIPVTSGTSYKFSVAGSKMALYGFEFTPDAYPVSTKSERNYGTMITPAGKKLDFANASGITAYIATGLNGASDAVVISSVDVVPAGTPIIVKTDSKGATINVPVTDESASDVTDNLLMAGDGTTAFDAVDGKTIYYLAGDEFHLANAGTLQSGKAYLAIPTSPTAPSIIRFEDEENNATDLESFKVQDSSFKFIENGKLLIMRDGVTYDAMGRVIR